MGYEDSPATEMVATHCALCSRPLVDVDSVEIGVGPVCRKKHLGDLSASDPEKRQEANRLIHHIAVRRHQTSKEARDETLAMVEALVEMGFHRVASAVMRGLARVIITRDNGRYVVKTSGEMDGADFSEMVEAFRGIPGRRWDREAKANTFPQDARAKLYQVLREFFPGETAMGPKGPFVIPPPSEAGRC